MTSRKTLPGNNVGVVIVGAGLAGLATARRLSAYDCLVLEARNRVGGRVLSSPSEPYWLNSGAHMVGDSHTPIGELVDELGLDARPIQGRLMGMVYGGVRRLSLMPELLPLALPLSIRSRVDMVRMGLKLRIGSYQFRQIAGKTDGEPDALQLAEFENHRTLAEYVGPLNREMTLMLRAMTERTGADPDEMSAGHGLRSFANVWVKSAPGRNLVGGTSLLPQAMAASLKRPVLKGAAVTEVVDQNDHVLVSYEHDGVMRKVRARAAVIATPAAIAARIANGLDKHTIQDLESVKSGAFLSVAVRTNEQHPMPWDTLYAISTPGRSFSVVFNMATTLRTGERRCGGSLMLFRGARGALELLNETDTKIEQMFLDDLYSLFPEVKGLVGEVVVKRWPVGAHYSYPGFNASDRFRLQQGRIVLAGDYLDFPNMEAALASGYHAADLAQAWLARDAASGHPERKLQG